LYAGSGSRAAECRVSGAPCGRNRSGQPSALAAIKPGLAETGGEKPQTLHYSIVDRWGNAVSNTMTLNGWFGSGVVVEGAGFLLNDEMDDFSVKPGVPNMYGVVGRRRQCDRAVQATVVIDDADHT
jgi:gamma-glutamyltranspeptidase